MQFNYSVRTQTGKSEKGRMEAPSKAAALQLLRDQQKIIISLDEDKHLTMGWMAKPSLSFEEKMLFAKHMATMIRAGISITESLEIMLDQTVKPKNKRLFQDLIQRVNSGSTLSRSLGEYPWIFSAVFVNMVATGEESGTLDQVFEQLDSQLEKAYDLRKKVMSAFIYPAVIVGITLIMVLGIVVFVMPHIVDIFKNFDADLPLPTRIMIGLSNMLTQHPFLSLLGIAATIGLGSFVMRIKALASFWAKVILHLPVFGTLMKNVNLTRFAQTLHSLLSAGVPITKALTIVESTMTNYDYKVAVGHVRSKVEQGGKLGEAFFEDQHLFPPIFFKMLAVGEKTGSLENTTLHLASLYERSVDNITKNLSTLLEPLLLVFMAMMVGGVAISIILPIYQLPNLIQK